MNIYYDKKVVLNEINSFAPQFDGLYKRIEALPTVIIEVKHGRWITKRDAINFEEKVFCSNCGRLAHFDKETYKYIESEYCPKCGCKMDLED